MVNDERFLVSGWEDDLHDIDPSRNPEEGTEKMFLKAAEDGELKTITDLVKINPALIQAIDKDGYTPLHRACYGNHLDIVKFLLENGADISAKTAMQWEPLHSCCHWNNKECAIALIQWGADINSESEGGQTPLHLCAAHGADYDMAQILLMHPYIKPNKISNTNDTPKDIAQRSSKFYNIFDIADPLLDISNLDLLA
ncbi:hypothetical protein HHI36_010721 [Cryptolaemus montrouzieri]|uniref:Uncharacterized protein n=1 Tax=Cryptolaemus montrouzieri TaxID=559131 RepID=A0ABD2MJN2_9CUCU